MKFVCPVCPDCGYKLSSRFYCSEGSGGLSYGVRFECFRCTRVVSLSLLNDTMSSFGVDVESLFFVPRFPY